MRTIDDATTRPQLIADLLVFAQVVDQGSFTAAAAALGVTKGQVTKQVRRLEERVGLTLLHRTTRRMALTQAGATLHPHAAALGRAAGAALEAVDQHGQQPAGRLRVSTSPTYGRHVLGHLLPAFIQRHPKVEVELLLLDRQVDLLEEGLDLAIRITDKPPPSLAGRPLHEIGFLLCAAPGLMQHHPITRPEELSGLPCMSFTAQARRNGATWQFSRGRERVAVDVQGPLVVNSSDMVRDLVVRELGFGLLPDFVVQEDLAAQRLAVALPQWRPSGSFGPTVWALWQPQRSMPLRLRAFIDHLVAQLCPTPLPPD